MLFPLLAKWVKATAFAYLGRRGSNNAEVKK